LNDNIQSEQVGKLFFLVLISLFYAQIYTHKCKKILAYPSMSKGRGRILIVDDEPDVVLTHNPDSTSSTNLIYTLLGNLAYDI